MVFRRKKEADVEVEGNFSNWIVTFADLMAILLTFFILLLSFAKTDIRKFKAAADSLRGAFGTLPFHQSPMSSFSPSLRGEDDKVLSQDFESGPHGSLRVPLDVGDICELEQQRRTRERIHAEDLKLHIEESMLRELTEEKAAMDIGVQGDRVRLRLSQDQIFKGQTTDLYKEKINFFKKLLSLLSDQSLQDFSGERLQIGITNYPEPPVGNTEDDWKKWKLSSDRSMVLAYIMGQMNGSRFHDIKVESWSSYETYEGEKQSVEEAGKVIDLFIGSVTIGAEY